MDELSAKKEVAIPGSSGGNLFYWGGKEPEKLLEYLITLSINKISVKKSKNMVREQKANKVAG